MKKNLKKIFLKQKRKKENPSHFKLATENNKARIQLHCTECATGSGCRESLPHRRLAAEACFFSFFPVCFPFVCLVSLLRGVIHLPPPDLQN